MKIYSREDLKQYCLRKLGAPVIDINVADEQVEDRIDDALEKFITYHAQGSELKYIAHQLTADDFTNKYITIPEEVINVVRVFPFGSGTVANINLEYQAFITDLINSTKVRNAQYGVHGYVITEQYLNLLGQFFNKEPSLRFNRYTSKLFLDIDWNKVSEDQFIIYECYIALSEDDYELFWNDWWLLSYSAALIKYQWGQNLIKYQGFQLPSGIVLNGDQILQEAKAEIAELDRSLQEEYQYPVDFMVG